jgi:hypothetical protein
MSAPITQTLLYTAAGFVSFLVIYLAVGLFILDPGQRLFVSVMGFILGLILGVVLARVRRKVFDGKPSTMGRSES